LIPFGRLSGRCRNFRDKHVPLNLPLPQRQQFAVGVFDALSVFGTFGERPDVAIA